MIFLKKICLILLLCILIISSILVFVFGTNFGTNLIFNALTHRIPELTFDSVSGNWGDFNVTNLSYNISSGVVNIDSCYISISLKHILFKQINIKHFFLKNVFVKIKRNLILNGKIGTIQLDSINNIFKNSCSIVIKNIVLDNINIILNDVEFRCQNISSGLSLHNNLLTILRTRIIGGDFLCKLSTDIFFNKSDITLMHKIFHSKNLFDVKTTFKNFLKNVLIALPKYNPLMDLMFMDIKGENFRIYHDNYHDFCYTINHFIIQADWNKKTANIKLKADLSNGYIISVSNIILSHTYPVDIIVYYFRHSSCKYNHNDQSKSYIKNIKFVLTGELFNTIYIRCDFFSIVSVMQIVLKIALKDLKIPIELSMIGKSIPIIVSRKNKYVLEEFNLYIAGELCNNYCVKFKSKITDSSNNSAYISLCAQANTNSFAISKLKIKILNGYCKMQGMVNWNKSIHWNNTYIFSNISFLKKYLESPIVLSGKIVMQGCLSANSWKLIVSELYCHGFFKGIKIICYGTMYMGSKDQLRIPMFFIGWGSNILKIQGKVQKDQMINFNLTLKIVNCSDFLPKLSSDIIYANFKIHGLITSPVLSLKIDIHNLDWKEQCVNINHITVRSNFFYEYSVKNNFYLKISHIQYKNLLLNELCIQGYGNVKKHNCNIIICSNEISGVINCIGEFDSIYRMWNGKINKAKIFTSLGTWELEEDIALIYQHLSQIIILKSHSWKCSNYQFIVSNHIRNFIFEKINLICKNYRIACLNIIPIESIHIFDARITCTDIIWNINNTRYLPKGSIFLSSSKLNIKYFDYQHISSITANACIINIICNQSDVLCNGSIKVYEDQNIVKFLITDIYNKPKISGIIQIKNIILNSIFQSSLLKSQQYLQGVLNIDVNVTGYFNCLEIYGFLKLKHLSINHSNIPFSLTNGMLEINFLGNYATVYGTLDTDHDNQLYIDGKITNINSIHYICMLLNVRSNQIEINISPSVYAKISPRLVCTITIEKIDIKGDIIVPVAYLKMKEFTKNVVEISSEEMVLDDQNQVILNKSENFFMLISSVLNIYLGDDVHFNGFGLHAKLKGNLEMIYTQNDFTLIGPVNIPSGYVEIYGQNLIIKKGQLLFSGSINQTYLDIEAIKNPTVFSNIKGPMIAGIHIAGLINKLKFDFFSDSSLLSQQQIMSYLLGGYSMVPSNTDDANMITSLLIGVSINRCEKLINKFGEILGIQDLKLSTQDFGMPVLIALSGYIAPGLQIQYGVNIFDLLSTITIRYCVYPHWHLEVKSVSDKQSLDLLYQFSFN